MTPITKSLYPPREVCDMLGIPESTLRYWSTVFPQINPKLTPAGHRRYTQNDIDVCRDIIFLLRDKGLSIEYAQKEMSRQRKYPPRQPRKCTSATEAISLLNEVRNATEDPHMASAVESVIKYLNAHKDVGERTD